MHGELSTLEGKIRELEKRLAIVERSDRLHSASIGRGGIRIHDAGSIVSDNFDGNAADVLADPGSAGWALGASGLVASSGTFRGEVRSAGFVEGESGYRLDPSGDVELNQLTLRDGLIGPAALAEQLLVTQHANSFGPTTLSSDTFVMSRTVPVPPWAATASVFGILIARADQLTGGAPQERNYRVRIAGLEGPPGVGGAGPSMQARTLTPLGSSFLVEGVFRILDSPAEDFECLGQMIVLTTFTS